jgi:hypothetical protein
MSLAFATWLPASTDVLKLESDEVLPKLDITPFDPEKAAFAFSITS